MMEWSADVRQKRLFFTLLAGMAGALSCATGIDDPPTDDPPVLCDAATLHPNMVVVPLVAGREDEVVGEIEVWLDGDDLHIHYVADEGWQLRRTDVAVGESLADLPTNPASCPRIGAFPWSDTHSPPVDEHEVVVDLAAAGLDDAESLVLAAHASVWSSLQGGAGAWGDGADFPNCSSIAEYFSVDLRALRGLVLWNTLDSAEAVAASEYGPNGAIVGDVSFVPAKYGNGFRPDPRVDKNTPNNYVEFEGLKLGPRGTIEFWYWPDWENYTVGHVVDILAYGVPGDPYNQHITEHFNDWQNRLGFGVVDSGAADGVSVSHVAPIPGWSTTEPIHVALTWDGCAPVPADRAMVYINGAALPQGSAYGDPTFDDWLDEAVLRLGSRQIPGDWDRHNWEGLDGVMDDIKVWDHPKTDFSDRYVE